MYSKKKLYTNAICFICDFAIWLQLKNVTFRWARTQLNKENLRGSQDS